MESNFLPCRSSPMSKIGLYAAVLLYPAVALALLFVPFLIIAETFSESDYTLWQVFILILASAAAIVLASFLLVLSRKCYLLETRHISVDRNGFSVIGRNKKRYEWNEVGGIGIIAYAASASKEIYQVQICIFFEPPGDDELRRLRDSYLYGVLNQDQYVLMDYEEMAMNRVSKNSDFPIEDLISLERMLVKTCTGKRKD